MKILKTKNIPKIFSQPIPIDGFEGKGSLLTSGSEENFFRKVKDHYSKESNAAQVLFTLKFLELIRFSGLDMSSKDFWEKFSYFLVFNFIKGFSFYEKKKEGRSEKWDGVTQLLLFLDVRKVMLEQGIGPSKACLILKDQSPWSGIIISYKSISSDASLYKAYTAARKSELVKAFSGLIDGIGSNILVDEALAELYQSLKNEKTKK